MEQPRARNLTLKFIYDRLASLEDDREIARLQAPFNHNENKAEITRIDDEMKALHLKLQDVMNSPCPLLKEQK